MSSILKSEGGFSVLATKDTIIFKATPETIRQMVQEYYFEANDHEDAARRIGMAFCPLPSQEEVKKIDPWDLMNYVDMVLSNLPTDKEFRKKVADGLLCTASTLYYDPIVLDYWFRIIPKNTAIFLGHVLIDYSDAEYLIDRSGWGWREHLQFKINMKKKILSYLKRDIEKSNQVATEYSAKMRLIASEKLTEVVEILSKNFSCMIHSTKNNANIEKVIAREKEEVLSAINGALNQI